MKYFSTRGGSDRLSFEDVRWTAFSPSALMTLDRLSRPSSLDLHQTEGCTSQKVSPPFHQIGRKNGDPTRLLTSPSRSFPSTSLKRRSLATIYGNWSRNRTAHSAIQTSRRSKNSTKSCSSLSFFTAQHLLSRMSRFSCLEIYSNSSSRGGTQRRPTESRERS